MYWREKLRTLWGHLRLTDGMAYCHDYPLFFEKVAQLLTVGFPELAPNAGRLPSQSITA
jgi:hypothetical protein